MVVDEHDHLDNLARFPVLSRVTGHTISQRLRKLKQIPAELIPLGNYMY